MAAPQDRDKKASSELVERLTLAGHGVHTGRDGETKRRVPSLSNG